MTTFPVDRKRRWNTAPGRRQTLFLSLASPDFQLADFIEFNRLEPRINHRQRITGNDISGPKLVFGVSALPHAEEKFSGLGADAAAYHQGIAQIGMAALIERSGQPDPRLYRNQHTLPGDLLNFMVH
jgi:hypothetical protein